MTKRQIEVLTWVQRGASNKAIAKRLGVSENTIKMHVGTLLKLHAVQNRQQLALYTLGNVAPVLPVLEVNPYCWIKHNDNFTGVSFNNQPDESWIAVYKK